MLASNLAFATSKRFFSDTAQTFFFEVKWRTFAAGTIHILAMAVGWVALTCKLRWRYLGHVLLECCWGLSFTMTWDFSHKNMQNRNVGWQTTETCPWNSSIGADVSFMKHRTWPILFTVISILAKKCYNPSKRVKHVESNKESLHLKSWNISWNTSQNTSPLFNLSNKDIEDLRPASFAKQKSLGTNSIKSPS